MPLLSTLLHSSPPSSLSQLLKFILGIMKAPFECEDPGPPAHILSLIEETIQNGKIEKILSLSKEDAQIVLDSIWNAYQLSSTAQRPNNKFPFLGSSPTTRSALRKISVELVLKHNILPPAMFLQNVKLLETDPQGGGSFADVYSAEHEGILVALKRIRTFSSTTEDEMQRKMKALHIEALLWMGLSHPNVLPFIGVSDNFKRDTCMVLLWRSTTIHQHRINLQAKGSLSIKIINEWLHQIALGLAYLHEEGIVHGDLHMGNILVDENGIPQLADFGMAAIASGMPDGYHPFSMHNEVVSSHSAPELLDLESAESARERPTSASDVYSFGYLAIELYTGKSPFPSLNGHQVPVRVSNGERPLRPSFPGGQPMANDLWDLIETCWAPQPQLRPRSKDIVKKLSPLILVKTLKPTNEIVELTKKREDQIVKDFALSDNYLVVLTKGTAYVYSLQDLEHYNTFDPPHGREFDHLAVAGDTLVICSSRATKRPPDHTISIWNLPGRLRIQFSIQAEHVFIAPVMQDTLMPIHHPSIYTTQPTFIVFHDKQVGQGGIGVLTLPHMPSKKLKNQTPLLESKHYDSFVCPDEALPINAVVARGEHAFASCRDSKIRQWNIIDGSCTQIIEMQHTVKSLCIDPLGEMFGTQTVNDRFVIHGANSHISSEPHARTFEQPHHDERCMTDMSDTIIHFDHVIGWFTQAGQTELRIWSHDFTSSRTLSHGNERIKGFHCKQRSIITVSESTIKVWDILTGTELPGPDLGRDCQQAVDNEAWKSKNISLRSNDTVLVTHGDGGHPKLQLWRFSDGDL